VFNATFNNISAIPLGSAELTERYVLFTMHYLEVSWSWSYGCSIHNNLRYIQSVPITTKVLCSNPDDGKAYSIQQYVIKFVSDLWKVSGFLRVKTPLGSALWIIHIFR
jgi:hypothetical protein